MRKFAPSYEDHVHRYAFALRHCYRKDVLDAGCKDGFGAQILSWSANTVTLADVSPAWLGFAERNGGYLSPATFILADFNVGFPEGTWDAVTAFEVIEHVDDPDLFLANIAAHLRPGGVLVFSVPHMVANHEHRTLFDEAKIRETVGRHLELVELHVQDRRYLTGEPMYRGLRCYVGVARKREDSLP